MKKILVIEDEDPIRCMILEMLEAEDFEGISANNGSLGLQLAQQHKPDLIICDVMMPELDGYGVISKLRQNPETKTIPFIFITAKASKDDLRYGMELGADDYLTKPFTVGELQAAITTRLEKKVALERQSQEKLEGLRSNIVLSLPHELRTPLNGILGTSELLLSTYELMDKEEVLEIVVDMHTSATRLHRLIQNFLLYAELELLAKNSQQFQALANFESSDTQSVITEVAHQKAQQANREADLYLELQNVAVQIAEPKLRKIAEEILDNAFKFSTAGTPIQVLGHSHNSIFTLSVSNEGRGMNAQQIANLGAYMQFERKLYEQQGSGLGFVIARRLAELHGGKLKIESTPHKQTTVEITLPISS